MMRFGFVVMSVLATPLAAADTRPPHVTDIAPVALRPGINRVPHFLPDGGTATIIEAWRGNGNAHGHRAWMVLTGPAEGNPVGLAPFDGGDSIDDSPFDGERILRAVRFARARVDGQPASLMVLANLEWTAGRPLADHEQATVQVYRLVAHDGIGPPLGFERIETLRSAKRYCNAELALRDELGIPLGPHYAGANRTDGCPVP